MVARVDATAVQARVFPGDRQAKPAAFGAAPGGVCLVKPLEDMRDGVGGQAGPVVTDLDR